MSTNEINVDIRPSGVTLLAIIMIGLALLSLLWSGLVFGVGGLSSIFGSLFGAENIAGFGGSSLASGLLGILSAILHIVVAGGLLSMKRWSWFVALIAVGLTVVQGVIGVFSGGFFTLCYGSIGLVIPGGIVFYLLQQDVREAFGV